MRTRVYDTLNRITNSIIENAENAPIDYGLLSGKSGVALFFYTLFMATEDNKYLRLGSHYLNRCIELIETKQLHPTYCGGIAGLALLSCLLSKERIIDDFVEPDIDNYLYKSLLCLLNDDNLDYLHGAIGIASYFAIKSVESIECDVAVKATDTMLEYLFRSRIDTDGCCKWLFFNRERQKESNISMSHGMSAIIVYLTRLISREYATKYNLCALCRSAINYINSQVLSVEENGSFYPYASTEKPNAQTKSRLAWCYGDLGIAISQYNAGIILKNPQITNNATNVLTYAARYRRNLVDNGVVDAGLCHGASGIAQCFNRMYLNTGIPLFKDALDYWIDKTLSFSSKGDFVGYVVCNPLGDDYHSINLLEGLSGIGLSLISYLFPESYRWDRVLNISL